MSAEPEPQRDVLDPAAQEALHRLSAGLLSILQRLEACEQQRRHTRARASEETGTAPVGGVE
jgi:hypothetical protein